MSAAKRSQRPPTPGGSAAARHRAPTGKTAPASAGPPNRRRMRSGCTEIATISSPLSTLEILTRYPAAGLVWIAKSATADYADSADMRRLIVHACFDPRHL